MIFLLKYLKLYKLEILTYIMIITIKNKIILWLLHNHRSNIIGNIYIYIPRDKMGFMEYRYFRILFLYNMI